MNPPDCPAQQGNGIDIACADFWLEAHDCGQITEIFGFFRPSGDDGDDEGRLNDALVTAIMDVPPVSVTSMIAHLVTADPSGDLVRKAGDMLRANIADCPCGAGTGHLSERECPALNEVSLLRALEHAID